MHDYIPTQDPDFDAWLKGFVQYAQAHSAELGLSPAEVTALTGAQAAFSAALSEHVRLHNLAKGAFETKKQGRKQAEEVVRRRAQIIQVRPETTDEHRRGLGLPIPDRKPTPQSPDLILATKPPLIVLDWSMRKQVTVHFGPNPGNEHENGLPEGMRGVKLFVQTGDGAEKLLVDDTNSPYVHPIETRVPVTVTYRAAYFDHQFRVGPLGSPASCTVSV